MTELASNSQLRASFMRWALFCVPGILLLGFLSAMVSGSGPGNPWFAALIKPSLYPPPQVFGMVWTALYVLMGLALAIVAAARGAARRGLAIGLFLTQLVVNLAWSPVFFRLHLMTGGLIVIGVLVVLLAATIVAFAKIRPLAAWLLAPYMVWILFAGVLNWQFLQANPGADGAQHSGAVQRIEL